MSTKSEILSGFTECIGCSDVFWYAAASFVVAALLAAYRFSTSTYGHWRDRNVPYAGPPAPLFGDLWPVARGSETRMRAYARLYERFAGRRYAGLFQMRTPYLMVRDPALVRRVLVTDFAHFTDHGLHKSGPRRNPLANGLFFMDGAQWRIMRSKLSPAFAPGRLRDMRGVIAECTGQLMRNVANALSGGGGGDLQVHDVLGNYSTDVIGTCAFGLRLNAIEDDESGFRKYGRTLFRPTPMFLVRELAWMIAPALRNALPLNDFPQDAIDFFAGAFTDTMNERSRNNVIRKDVMQSLIQARTDLVVEKTEPSVNFEETDIVANAFIMFAAGFETVSNTMTFCLYELALQKRIQDRVRDEILTTKAKHDGRTVNELLTDLHYLEMVLAETLRKYPSLLTLFRVATMDYQVPDDHLVIEKGTKIIIPMHAIHHDPQYYPDPEKFDPERFSAEEKAKRPGGTYMPFGDGPRICIGKRFAEMEMKLALAELLTEYEVEPCERTHVPMKYGTQSFVVQPENGLWLKFKPIRRTSETAGGQQAYE